MPDLRRLFAFSANVARKGKALNIADHKPAQMVSVLVTEPTPAFIAECPSAFRKFLYKNSLILTQNNVWLGSKIPSAR
jgi:hypothetical protein